MENADADKAIDSAWFGYGLALAHKHVPEMREYSALEHPPLFSPSVGRFRQGMVVQVPLYLEALEGDHSQESIHALLAEYYAGQDIVRVVPLAESGSIARLNAEELAGQDIMKIYVFGGGAHVNLVAQLDNLGKGASGAAVQNMDLMLSA